MPGIFFTKFFTWDLKDIQPKQTCFKIDSGTGEGTSGGKGFITNYVCDDLLFS